MGPLGQLTRHFWAPLNRCAGSLHHCTTELGYPHPGKSWKIPSDTHYVYSQDIQIVLHLSSAQGGEFRAILLPVAKPQQVIQPAGSISSLPQHQARWSAKTSPSRSSDVFSLEYHAHPPWNSCQGTPLKQHLAQSFIRVSFVLCHELQYSPFSHFFPPPGRGGGSSVLMIWGQRMHDKEGNLGGSRITQLLWWPTHKNRYPWWCLVVSSTVVASAVTSKTLHAEATKFKRHWTVLSTNRKLRWPKEL